MSWEYSENILVQGAAGDLLEQELGWRVVFAYNKEKLGADGTLGRTDYREILLKRDFRAALKKLNPWLTDAQITEAEKQMEHRLSTASLMQINEEKYTLIRDGIPVTVKRPDGKTETKRAQVIDFANPLNNDFLAVKEMKIHGELYRRRTDIVGFVNGIPLLFIELKALDVNVEDAYTCNYTDYLDTIPHLFYYNAFLMLSNGTEAKIGTLGSKYEFFHEWKRLAEEDQGSVALETMLRGVCKKENFIDLLEMKFLPYMKSICLSRHSNVVGMQAVLPVICKCVHRSDESGNVASCLAGKIGIDVPEVTASAGSAYGLGDIAGTAVV